METQKVTVLKVKKEVREIRQTLSLRGRNIKPVETQTAWGGV